MRFLRDLCETNDARRGTKPLDHLWKRGWHVYGLVEEGIHGTWINQSEPLDPDQLREVSLKGLLLVNSLLVSKTNNQWGSFWTPIRGGVRPSLWYRSKGTRLTKALTPFISLSLMNKAKRKANKRSKERKLQRRLAALRAIRGLRVTDRLYARRDIDILF